MADTPQQDRAEATAQIREDGAAFQIKRTPSRYNAKTSRTEEGATETYDGHAADWEYRERDIDGTLILRGDVRLIVAAEDQADAEFPTPANGDLAIYAGERLNVIGTTSIRKAGIAITYVVQLRKP